MNPKTKKLWQLTALLALDLIILILISSVSANAEMLGNSGERVAEIQRVLKKQNLYQGNENGVFDFRTKNAVAEFRIINGKEKSGEVNYETLCALGLDTRASVCFSSEAELLARCITLSGCRTYPEMLDEADKIIRNTSKATTLGKYISSNFPFFLSDFVTPSPEAYSAAVQAIRKSAHLGGHFYLQSSFASASIWAMFTSFTADLICTPASV